MTSRALAVGAAVVDITPEAGAPMSGFAARTEPAVGVHDQLAVRAIAVTDGDATSLVLVADLLALDARTVDALALRISAATGIAAPGIAICVTHTHGGPAVGHVDLGAAADPDYLLRVDDVFVAAAQQAWTSRRPAHLTMTRAEVTGVGHNRRGDDLIDPAAITLRWSDDAGAPIATVFSYACHPVTLGPDNLQITADWPATAREIVEAQTGGVAIYLQGCAGQINTGHLASDSFRSGSTGRTFERAAELGGRVAEAVLGGDEAATPSGTALVDVRRTICSLPLQPRADDGQLDAWAREWSDHAAATTDDGLRALLEMWARWARGWIGHEAPTTLPLPVAAHRWGDARLVFLPGEPFVQFALGLRTTLQDRLLSVVGYSGGVPGYIPFPAAEYHNGGYEVGEAHRGYGQPAPFAPTAGERLFESANRLAAGLYPDTSTTKETL